MDLKTAIAEYLGYIKSANYANGTIQKYARFLDTFSSFISDTYIEIAARVENTSYPALRSFLDAQAGAPKTRCNHIGMLRSFGKMLVQELDLIFPTNNPYLRLRRPKLATTVPRAPEATDLVQALSFPIYLRKPGKYKPTNPYHQWMNERNKLILFTLAITGIRRSELIALTWRDVAGGRMVARGKGDKERVIPLPPNLVKQFSRFRSLEIKRSRGSDNDAILWAHKAGRETEIASPMGDKSVYEIVCDVLSNRVSGWERVTPHVLRHAALTALVEADADIVTVAAIAGHSNINTTFRNYVAPRDKRKAAALQASALTRLADAI